jgi:hypothetical protein
MLPFLQLPRQASTDTVAAGASLPPSSKPQHVAICMRLPLCAQVLMHMPDPQHMLQPMNGAMGHPQQAMGTSEPLQLTQLLGSEAEQQVLLTQPKVHIIARAKMPRGDRLVSTTRVLAIRARVLAGWSAQRLDSVDTVPPASRWDPSSAGWVQVVHISRCCVSGAVWALLQCMHAFINITAAAERMSPWVFVTAGGVVPAAL